MKGVWAYGFSGVGSELKLWVDSSTPSWVYLSTLLSCKRASAATKLGAEQPQS